eukprot:m.900827 g.900827  ORF g.900827 m.900827 type:complete len:592 (-) comp60050_c0_seq5:2209-3984(-)
MDPPATSSPHDRAEGDPSTKDDALPPACSDVNQIVTSATQGAPVGAWEIDCNDPALSAKCRSHFVAWQLEVYYWQRSAVLRFMLTAPAGHACLYAPVPLLTVNLVRVFRKRTTVCAQYSSKTFSLRALEPSAMGAQQAGGKRVLLGAWEAPLPTDAFRLGYFWRHRRARAIFAMSCRIEGQRYWSPRIFVDGINDWSAEQEQARDLLNALDDICRDQFGAVGLEDGTLALDLSVSATHQDDSLADPRLVPKLSSTDSTPALGVSRRLEQGPERPQGRGPSDLDTSPIQIRRGMFQNLAAQTARVSRLHVDEIFSRCADLSYEFPVLPNCGTTFTGVDQAGESGRKDIRTSGLDQEAAASRKFHDNSCPLAPPGKLSGPSTARAEFVHPIRSGDVVGVFFDRFSGLVGVRALTESTIWDCIQIGVVSESPYLTANTPNAPPSAPDVSPSLSVRLCMLGVVCVRLDQPVIAGEQVGVGVSGGKVIVGASGLFEGRQYVPLGVALRPTGSSETPFGFRTGYPTECLVQFSSMSCPEFMPTSQTVSHSGWITHVSVDRGMGQRSTGSTGGILSRRWLGSVLVVLFLFMFGSGFVQ